MLVGSMVMFFHETRHFFSFEILSCFITRGFLQVSVVRTRESVRPCCNRHMQTLREREYRGADHMCRHVTPHTSDSDLLFCFSQPDSFSSFPKHHCHFLLQKTSCPYNAICLGGTLTPSKKFHHIFFSPRKDC